MADKQAITELLNHGAVAYDAGDVDFLTDMFVEDGVFTIRIQDNDPSTFEGRDAIRSLYAGSLESQDDQRRHVIANLYFESETDDSARAVSYLVLLTVKGGSLTVLSTGVYTDDVVSDGGSWRLKKRLLELDLPY